MNAKKLLQHNDNMSPLIIFVRIPKTMYFLFIAYFRLSNVVQIMHGNIRKYWLSNHATSKIGGTRSIVVQGPKKWFAKHI